MSLLRQHHPGGPRLGAVHVPEEDNALTATEHASDGEERWITLGVDALGRLLVVVYTWRKSRVRIISARPATPGERAWENTRDHPPRQWRFGLVPQAGGRRWRRELSGVDQ